MWVSLNMANWTFWFCALLTVFCPLKLQVQNSIDKMSVCYYLFLTNALYVQVTQIYPIL